MIKSFLFNKLLPNIYRFYLSVNLKTKKIEIEENSKCLCLAPHADDESIGVGGTLFKNPEKFNVICLTNGIKGAKKYSPEEALKVRQKEFSDAMAVAGVKNFSFLGIDDKHIISEYEKFRNIDIEDYDYIFIPNVLDQHMDHKSVALNLSRLLKEKKHKKDLKIMMYEVWSALPMPNAFVDISDCIEKKKEMINCHVSQVELKNYTDKAVALNSYRGLPHDIDFAEAFIMLDVPAFERICKACV